MIDQRHGAADDDNDVLWMLLGARALALRVQSLERTLDRRPTRPVLPNSDEDLVLLAVLGVASVARRIDQLVERTASETRPRARTRPDPPLEPDEAPDTTRELLR